MSALLEARAITQHYALRRGRLLERRPMLAALDAVDFAVSAGEAVGLVGESGSGKTTLTRILTGAEAPAVGSRTSMKGWSVVGRARPPRAVSALGAGGAAKSAQFVRPAHAHRCGSVRTVAQPADDGDHAARVHEVLEQVGMSRAALVRFPHEFSGGQLQRLAIARALMPGPKVLIADEPVSSLDVSIQAQVLNLLKDLVRELGLGLVLVAHDLSVVAYTTGRVCVMAAGRIVEAGAPRRLFTNPQAQATRNLVDAILSVEAGLAGGALD